MQKSDILHFCIYPRVKRSVLEKYNWKHILGFVIPSILGVVLFMIPVEVDGTWTVIVKVIADLIGSRVAEFFPLFTVRRFSSDSLLYHRYNFSGFRRCSVIPSEIYR